MSDGYFDAIPTVESAVSWTTPFPEFSEDYYVDKTVREIQRSHLERIVEEERLA